MDSPDVADGSDDLVWQSPTLEVRACSVSSMDNNVYLLTCVATRTHLLVDAADQPNRIAALVPGGLQSLDLIVTTHRHWDHHRALAEVADVSGATTCAGVDDADSLPTPPQVRLAHGDTVRIGDLTAEVVALRGHTPGSIALSVPGGDAAGTRVLLTGDSLFPGGPGKTESAADFTSLMDDLEQRVFAEFADETLVLPGHGAGTTIGAERPHLRQWRQRGW
ncbi:MAG TPA: MBL fold metallo-hydrolase [Ornithinimicrobium sp.]|uniref:MBL fold metallo-hydrolase n=1 Tax=Ornithinimicrobium sp. TaxID=1977084 RepID=UPI002B4635C5|nr:MBL fold metallo-hydrolase [Ornithinimicrobium sp.]HKJ11595.1 MBL fold metallo-hydrolase [Ornithinimicrobium sp.]